MKRINMLNTSTFRGNTDDNIWFEIDYATVATLGLCIVQCETSRPSGYLSVVHTSNLLFVFYQHKYTSINNTLTISISKAHECE